jgi:hypothetical protein
MSIILTMPPRTPLILSTILILPMYHRRHNTYQQSILLMPIPLYLDQDIPRSILTLLIPMLPPILMLALILALPVLTKIPILRLIPISIRPRTLSVLIPISVPILILLYHQYYYTTNTTIPLILLYH